MSDSLSDSLRIYLRELRIIRGISQEKVADAIGWSLRSFSDWETGKSGDIKARYLIRLVSFLQASFAKKRVNSPIRNTNYEEELHDLIEQLWSDESLRKAFLIFWSGWKAKE